jgi:hypothetical protein
MNVKLRGVSILAAALFVSTLGSAVRGAARPAQQLAVSHTPATERALVDKYCVTCHNDRARTGGLSLQALNLDNVRDGAETWEKVVRKLRGGMMPPLGAPRPNRAGSKDSFRSWRRQSTAWRSPKPNPGRSPLHRLNRSEYANAIRDLLALDIDATAYLPADDEANGFDNIADVLKVSPSLLEQYLTASRKIASLAVGDPKTNAVSAVYRVPPDRAQGNHVEGLPLGTRGGIVIRHTFPLDADYDFRVNLLQNIVGYVPGLEWPHQLEIAVDGERVFWRRSAASTTTSCRTRTWRLRGRARPAVESPRACEAGPAW